jgi:hypothetical protein
MNGFAYLSAAAVVLLASGAAMADPIPYTATVTSGYLGNPLSLLSDGVIPADYTPWNDIQDVWTYDSTTSVRFDFAGLRQITSMLATVDNNDDYVFTFYNGAAQTGQVMAAAADGFVSVSAGGVETFEGGNSADIHYYSPFDFSGSPILATSVVLSIGPNNDSALGIGEVQFLGGAVPEPASWAMMVTGFGLAGAALRRKRSVHGFA